MAEQSRHRVVIVGSGFAGLFAARFLRRSAVEVTLLARTNHHLFQPLLYQVATGILSEGEIAPATRDVLRHHRSTRVQMAEVTGFDLDRRVVGAVQAGRHVEVPYDSLIVAAGVETSYLGHDDLMPWAPGMKSIDDALELRGRIFGAFEMAEVEADPVAREAWLTFVLVGGGPTGVEMAGEIAELSRRSLHHDFRSVDPRQARILLFEGGDRILAGFGERLSRLAAHDLAELGVEVHTGTMVTAMDEAGVTVRGPDGGTRRVPARTKVWAAGTVASPLARQLAEASGAGVDRMGRVQVLPDCTLPGHPEVFCVGDMMALGDLPGMAEVAIQSGVHAARLVTRRLGGDMSDPPFRYHDLGQLAVISRFRAVAKLGPLSVGGLLGWLLWLVVHLTFLTGFKNRASALAHWAVSFLGRSRAERTFTRQQVAGAPDERAPGADAPPAPSRDPSRAPSRS